MFSSKLKLRGSAIVVIDFEFYRDQITEMLSNDKFYKKQTQLGYHNDVKDLEIN